MPEKFEDNIIERKQWVNLPGAFNPAAAPPLAMSSDEEDEDLELGGAASAVSDATFTTGSVRRIRLHNFLTYHDCEFFPGARLNMVIGPNGSGKSSIVCALALGPVLAAAPLRALQRARCLLSFDLACPRSPLRPKRAGGASTGWAPARPRIWPRR